MMPPPSNRPAPPAGPAGSPAVAARTLRTHDPAEAQLAVQRLYPGVTVEPFGREAFSCELRATNLGPATLVTASWSGGGRMRSRHLHGRHVLSTSVQGGFDVSFGGGEQLGTVPERRAMLFSPGFAGELRAGSAVRIRAIAIDSAALPAHVATLVGSAPKEPIVFEPSVSLEEGPGAVLHHLVQTTFRAVEHPGTSPLLLASLRETLLTTLLTGMPHSASHLFERPPPSTSRACVRRAEEFIAAHAAEELTVARIAEAAGVPVRSLQIALQAARGMTPMELVRERRFELARRSLLAAAPGTTVMSVLTSLGFGASPGRFSVQYRLRFGESPSDTLVAARARNG